MPQFLRHFDLPFLSLPSSDPWLCMDSLERSLQSLETWHGSRPSTQTARSSLKSAVSKSGDPATAPSAALPLASGDGENSSSLAWHQVSGLQTQSERTSDAPNQQTNKASVSRVQSLVRKGDLCFVLWVCFASSAFLLLEPNRKHPLKATHLESNGFLLLKRFPSAIKPSEKSAARSCSKGFFHHS